MTKNETIEDEIGKVVTEKLADVEISFGEKRADAEKTVFGFMRKNFYDNNDFLKKAEKTFRKNANEKVYKILEFLGKIVVQKITVSDKEVGEFSNKEISEIMLETTKKSNTADGIKVSKSFKKLVERELSKSDGAQIADIDEKEISGTGTNGKRNKENGEGNNKEYSIERLEKDFGAPGAVYVSKRGEVFIVDKYILNGNGVLRVAYYDSDGYRRACDIAKFKNKVDGAKRVEYVEKVQEDLAQIVNLMNSCSEFLKKGVLSKDETKDFKQEMRLIKGEMDKFKDVDIDKASAEDFAEVRNILARVKLLNENMRKKLKDIEIQAQIGRKEKFKKKFGLDTDYVLLAEDKNGHSFAQKSFTVIEYYPGKNAKKDLIEIEWHNEDGAREKISRKKFFFLLKKGYKKEEEIQAAKKKSNSAMNKAEENNDENKLSQEAEEAKRRADKYRDEYFEEMGWGDKKEKEKIDEELVGDMELADRLKNDKGRDKDFTAETRWKNKLEEIIAKHPELEREIIRRTFDSETRETAYDKADFKDKVLMLLGEKSNQARRKYLEKDYDMDRRLGGLKRFFGKTFRIDNYEKELESYKREYEQSREEYKNALLELEGVGDREEAEILARDFQISEQLRWRSDRLDIAMENNPIYENFKKFLTGAVEKYRKMRRWPSDKINEVFGFKGLKKGLGIVSGLLLTGKALKEVGMVGNPAYRIFSVAVASVGYKQGMEAVAERRRIKKSEKKIKEAKKIYGAEFEAGKNLQAFSEWLSERNKELDKRIQGEKYWRNWRTIMAGGAALGTFIGGDILGRKIIEHFGGHHDGIVGDEVEHTAGKQAVQTGKMVESGNVNTEKLKESVQKNFPNYEIKSGTVEDIKVEEVSEKGEKIVSSENMKAPEKPVKIETPLKRKVRFRDMSSSEGVATPASGEVSSSDNSEYVTIRQGDNVLEPKPIDFPEHSEQSVGGNAHEVVDPNIEQHRNITGSEMQLAYGLGFSPSEYAKINDLPLSRVSDADLDRLLTEFGVGKNIDLNKMTVSEFLRQLDAREVADSIKLRELSGSDYVDYFAKVIANESVEIKKTLVSANVHHWITVKNTPAIGEREKNFSEFYKIASRKLSFYARPMETVDSWITRMTKVAYERGMLQEIKKDLEEIIKNNKAG